MGCSVYDNTLKASRRVHTTLSGRLPGLVSRLPGRVPGNRPHRLVCGDPARWAQTPRSATRPLADFSAPLCRLAVRSQRTTRALAARPGGLPHCVMPLDIDLRPRPTSRPRASLLLPPSTPPCAKPPPSPRAARRVRHRPSSRTNKPPASDADGHAWHSEPGLGTLRLHPAAPRSARSLSAPTLTHRPGARHAGSDQPPRAAPRLRSPLAERRHG